GIGKMSSRRFVDFGTAFSAQADADWWAGEGHVSARAGLPMHVSRSFVITPQTQLTYVALDEQNYEESGGGTAIDLNVDGTLTHRLWADVGIDFAGRFGRVGATIIAPHLTLGYRANLIDEAAERTMHFGSAGTPFTLVDETTGSGGPLVAFGIDATNG